MKLKIGNVTVDNNLIVTPMGGVTQLQLRVLCREKGGGRADMRMVRRKGI